MSNDMLEEQNLNLITEINTLNTTMNSLEIPQALKLNKNVSLLDKLFGRKKQEPQPDLLQPFYPLDLGNWSNVLYYQLDSEKISRHLFLHP